ncbi:NAD(P)H-binding protein [Paraconexibacter sp.]|uniref:NAD(P)H-binding protein n=1 Tax=Paraconexibacter sp. TaxID=2949640 RepID=UPI0035624BE7
MLLLTGATGTTGAALLRRLTAAGVPTRVLVRDPKRLGPERVRVQIALGDLADPPSFRNALRGVTTVVHLAAASRDQPQGSIEELGGIATWRMVAAAEKAGVEHFVFFSALSASAHNRTRFLRSKALAEKAVAESGLRHTIFAPSIVYAPGDPALTLIARLALLPVVPMSGRGRALFQPIWADDAADCVMSVLGHRPAGAEIRAAGGDDAEVPRSARYELAGPETLTGRELVDVAVRAAGRPRPILPVPTAITSRVLRAAELLVSHRALATWDEAELLEVSMTSRSGTADAERLGVSPRRMAAVLGAA